MNLLSVLLLAGLPQGSSELTLENFEREIIAIVEKARPSVVEVTASGGDEIFQNSIAPPATRRLSGIIVSSDGHILTDLGGVDSARTILVTLHDGRKFDAERLGIDRTTSVALLRIRAEGLTQAEFADPDTLRQGSVAVLISNPAGLGGTSSVGFVSGLRRTVRVNGLRFDDLIQTSATVQSGDAGGLLANARGLVLGMIHSRFEPSELEFDLAGFPVPVPFEELKSFPAGGAGVGFATPASTLKFVAERLIKHGKVVRGWMGVTLRKAGPHAVVTEVADKGPAARSGLKTGDLLVEFDGKPVTDILSVKRRVEASPVPAKLRARVVRAGAEMDLELIVETEPKP
jgi:S1-C subfamily serine protease